MPTDPEAYPLDIEYVQNPHEIEAKLRIEASVRLVQTPRGMRSWLVTRYEDVKQVLTSPDVHKDEGRRAQIIAERHGPSFAVLSPAFRLLEVHMLNSDPPDHTRLRRLVAKVFTTRAIARLRPRIESVTAELLDAMAGQDRVDLVASFAAPLPMIVICELLGVPETDREKFGSWVEVITSAGDQRLVEASELFLAYLRELVTAKRAEPAEDLLSDLVAVTDSGDRLSEQELVAMAELLVIAGHDTTVSLIANGTLALLRAPAQLAALRADPSLVPNAVEELLRYDGPVHIATTRFTTAPITVGGVEIPANEFLSVSLLSANRDGERFADPDELDVTRPAGGHLAFGHGIHHCLGAPLARLEGAIALGALIERFPALRLADGADPARWRFSTLMHGLEELPVATR
ncbi:cytochrome P450 [Amycolatopsis sp. NPDC051372]|uniref:cytochrome P450 family protein n=1 Tax=Amycolatopsis sp. NPDC051372 TaxID=3155669 RepID=UPI0034138C4A